VLHAVLIGTPEATYDHLEGMETAQARRERIRLRDRLLTRTHLTTAERATLLDAQATDALLGGTADLDQLNAWSAALIALVPQAPSARTTRAAVLILTAGGDVLSRWWCNGFSAPDRPRPKF